VARKCSGPGGATTSEQWRTRECIEGVSNTEEDWLACPVASSLLARVLTLGASERKLRLFGCACCRLVWHNLVRPESKAAVEAAERYADGAISAEELHAAAEAARPVVSGRAPLQPTDHDRRAEYVEYASAVAPTEVARAENEGGWPYWERLVEVPFHVVEAARLQGFGLHAEEMEAALCDRLRDVFGNPFRPVTIDPTWRTNTVMDLARAIYDGRAFDRLPVLADALEEAGCTARELLGHCRGGREHVLGCWALDSILGNK
jgi:hypothetical protein